MSLGFIEVRMLETKSTLVRLIKHYLAGRLVIGRQGGTSWTFVMIVYHVVFNRISE